MMGEVLEKEKLPKTTSSGVFTLNQGVFSLLAGF